MPIRDSPTITSMRRVFIRLELTDFCGRQCSGAGAKRARSAAQSEGASEQIRKEKA